MNCHCPRIKLAARIAVRTAAAICSVATSLLAGAAIAAVPVDPNGPYATLTIGVSGTGAVAYPYYGQNCFVSSCAVSFPFGSTVTLNPVPQQGSAFSGWSGACSGSGNCTVTMNGAQSVTATFTSGGPPLIYLYVSMLGAGNVTSSPAGIDCTSSGTLECGAGFAPGTVVTLTGTTVDPSFPGVQWNGPCRGTGSCTIVMNADQLVFASLGGPNTGSFPPLQINIEGNGSVTVSPSGTVCASICEPDLSPGTVVTLTPMPAAGAQFLGWSGPAGCSGQGACTLTLDLVTLGGVGNHYLYANFSIADTYCPGAVQSGWWWNPAQGGRGFLLEQQAASVYFGAFVYDASGHAGWSVANANLVAGAPGVTDGCNVTGELQSFSGGQTLTGAYRSPTGASDLGSMTLHFSDAAHGVATLPGETIPIQRYVFAPNGGAIGPGAAQPETGIWWNPFEGGRGFGLEIQNNVLYGVGYMYDGNGLPVWYASGPGAVDASGTYHGQWAQYANGQALGGAYRSPITLNPDVGALTLQFSNPATGVMTLPAGSQIPMQKFVYAPGGTAMLQVVVLDYSQYPVDGLTGPVGPAEVVSSPAGIACVLGGVCSASFKVGTQVTLSPVPPADTTFAGWTGACGGTGDCVVTVGANQTVGAAFALATDNAVLVRVAGPGDVLMCGLDVNQNQQCLQNTCRENGQSCIDRNATSRSITLTATPDPTGARFVGWSGDCAYAGSSPVCTVSMSVTRNVGAAFLPPGVQ
jgi:List-Bact-rpt repeat protein